jgi:hypothetical protein
MPIFIVAIVLNAVASLLCGTVLPRIARGHVARSTMAETPGAPAFARAVAGGSQ